MRQKIQYKLFSVMLLSAIWVILCMAVIVQWGFDNGFLDYIDRIEQKELHNFTESLEHFYHENKSWNGLKDNPAAVLHLYAESQDSDGKTEVNYELINKEGLSSPEDLGPFYKKRPDGPPPDFFMRVFLLDEDHHSLIGHIQKGKKFELTPIYYQKKKVGYLGRYLPRFMNDARQVSFIRKQKGVIFLITLVVLAITMLLSLPLAYHFTRPVRRLSQAARRLILGDYSVRVRVTSDDEIGSLSHDFNLLAGTLAVNMEHRKRLVSDVAHELRTPLNSLLCEIEAMQDGVEPVDDNSLDGLHSSVMRLNHLVSDLKSLSLTDEGGFSYSFEVVDFRTLVEQEMTSKRREMTEAGLRFESRLQEGFFFMDGDVQRLQQLLFNILYNSLSYTDRGGAIHIDLSGDNNFIDFEIRDTAPGVSDEDLPYLCERLYRAEKSRNRHTGGAGLGLAIARGIVEAHHGQMEVSHAKEGGLRVAIRFPRKKRE